MKNDASYIQNLFADRIGGARFGSTGEIYKFEKIKRAKAAARRERPDVELIDMGVGEPDEMAFPAVVESLCAEAAKKENRGYADNGITEFKVAAAEYLRDVFGVEGIDPSTQINHAIGAKSALALIPLAFVNRSDVLAQTVPGYPVMATRARDLGADVVSLPINESNGFIPDLDSIDSERLERLKLLYLNYPNNPTGAMPNREFFEKVVRFATDHKVIVVHDAAYAALVYGRDRFSFLSIDGASDVGVEIHSFSKSHNMTGWRIGFLAGSELVVKGFAHVKDNADSGQFIPIQKAAIAAARDVTIIDRINAKYERRMKALVTTLRKVGFDAKMPAGSFFLYTKAPKATEGASGNIKFANAEEFSQWLILSHQISTVPWDDAGAYVRFSVTFEACDEREEKRIFDLIAERLSSESFVF